MARNINQEHTVVRRNVILSNMTQRALTTVSSSMQRTGQNLCPSAPDGPQKSYRDDGGRLTAIN